MQSNVAALITVAMGSVCFAPSHSHAADFEVVESSVDPEAPLGTSPDLKLELAGLLVGSLEDVDGYPVDAEGTRYESGQVATTRLRFGASANYILRLAVPVILHADVEGDFESENLTRSGTINGADYPGGDDESALMVRRGFVRLSVGPFVHLGGGITTSSWGLGLLANDGARLWEPKSASFVNPTGGDVVLRGLIGTGPLTPVGLSAFLFVDSIQDDDVLREGDEASQFGGGIRIGGEGKPGGGIYAVRRSQEAEDGATTDVDVVDIAAEAPFCLGRGVRLELAAEVAYLHGETTLAPNFDAREHDIRQLGGAVRAKLDAGRIGGVLDLLWATGDQNFDDAEQNAFKADRNYESGMLLFRHVIAAQTARAPATASDPNVVGMPSPDLDRIPTRGSATNTIALFPRAYWQPADGLELFGGPLVAFSDVPLSDPFNTRTSGGDPHNAFNGAPSSYLGTELDVGVRGRMNLSDHVTLTGGLDGALLIPGSAFDDASGEALSPIFGARTIAQMTF